MENSGLRVFMENARKGYRAEGFFDGKGITILAGSRARIEQNTITPTQMELRRVYFDEQGVLKQNLYLGSPSLASNLICGRSSNGWKEWTLESGEPLAEYRRRRIENLHTRSAVEREPARAQQDSPLSGARDLEPPAPKAAPWTSPVSGPAAAPKAAPAPTPAAAPKAAPAPSPAAAPKADIAPAPVAMPGTETAQPPKSTPKIDAVPASDGIVADLMRQVAQLREMVLRQQKIEPVAAQAPEVQDRRYRIAVCHLDAPELRLPQEPGVIRNLTFSLPLRATGEEGQQAKYRLFILDEAFEVVSNSVNVAVETGMSVNCRFTIASRMSKHKKCFLAIQDTRDMQDELQKLIPLEIQILFEADFDL